MIIVGCELRNVQVRSQWYSEDDRVLERCLLVDSERRTIDICTLVPVIPILETP